MSGLLIAALAGLLTPQAAPHPSSQDLYVAPAIRPFEPGSDFGREVAEGDAAPAAHRAPLAASVTVDAYARSYEYAPTDAEAAYEQGVASAELRTDQAAGPLDGIWLLVDADGRVICRLMLSDLGGGRVEGGWRGEPNFGGALAEGGVLTLEGLGAVTLEPAAAGWRGRLSAAGQSRAVSLRRP
jgi:hypothetical protein